MTASLIMDGAVAVLLVATLGFCFVLNRRIGSLRRTSARMARLISEFDVSIEKARESVEALKQAAGVSGAELQERLDAASALRDELAFLSGADIGVKGFPSHAPPLDGGLAAPESELEDDLEMSGERADASRSEAEKELVEALRQAR